MKAIRSNLALLSALALLLAVAVGVAYADEHAAACTGDSVTGTVVAVDVETGEVTFEMEDGSLCSANLNEDFEHPITSLLGSYFSDLDLDELEDYAEDLLIELYCDEGEECTINGGESDPINARITDVTDNGDGTWTIEFTYTNDADEKVTETFVTDDQWLAESWAESLQAVQGTFPLSTDGDGNALLAGAGDQIEALHSDGMGFGVIVKLFAMAEQAEMACEGLAGEPDPEAEFDPCEVDVDSLVTAFQEGTGLGQLFQLYGRPSILGVGHVRNASNGNSPGTPPDNACGYWRNHGDGYLPEACQAQPGGKPPWAGSPGGPNGGNNGD